MDLLNFKLSLQKISEIWNENKIKESEIDYEKLINDIKVHEDLIKQREEEHLKYLGNTDGGK